MDIPGSGEAFREMWLSRRFLEKKKLLLKGVGEFHFAFLYLFWDRGKDFAHHVIMFKCYNAF